MRRGTGVLLVLTGLVACAEPPNVDPHVPSAQLRRVAGPTTDGRNDVFLFGEHERATHGSMSAFRDALLREQLAIPEELGLASASLDLRDHTYEGESEEYGEHVQIRADLLDLLTDSIGGGGDSWQALLPSAHEDVGLVADEFSDDNLPMRTGVEKCLSGESPTNLANWYHACLVDTVSGQPYSWVSLSKDNLGAGGQSDERVVEQIGFWEALLGTMNGVYLYEFYQGSDPATCTAAKVGTRYLLTANHCVREKGGAWYYGDSGLPYRGEVCFVGNGLTGTPTCFTVNGRWTKSSGWGVGNDFALLRVDEDLYGVSYPISTKAKSVVRDSTVRLWNHAGILPEVVLGQTGINPVQENLGPPYEMIRGDATVKWLPGAGSAIGTNGTTAPGASGSPILDTSDTVPEIVGLNTQWFKASNLKRYTGGPAASAFRTWADGILP